MWSRSPPNPPAQCLPGEGGRWGGGAGKVTAQPGELPPSRGNCPEGDKMVLSKIQDRKWQRQHLSQANPWRWSFPASLTRSLFFLSFCVTDRNSARWSHIGAWGKGETVILVLSLFCSLWISCRWFWLLKYCTLAYSLFDYWGFGDSPQFFAPEANLTVFTLVPPQPVRGVWRVTWVTFPSSATNLSWLLGLKFNVLWFWKIILPAYACMCTEYH